MPAKARTKRTAREMMSPKLFDAKINDCISVGYGIGTGVPSALGSLIAGA